MCACSSPLNYLKALPEHTFAVEEQKSSTDTTDVILTPHSEQNTPHQRKAEMLAEGSPMLREKEEEDLCMDSDAKESHGWRKKLCANSKKCRR